MRASITIVMHFLNTHTHRFNESIYLYIDLAVIQHQCNNPAYHQEQIHCLHCLEERPPLQWGGKNIFCVMSSLRADRQDPERVFFPLVWGNC